jgi:energy-coupling factor transport system ATP-binding protein
VSASRSDRGAHIHLCGFGWRHAGRNAWAVRGVDLRIERGERVLLLGPSGAGKSTLLAALAGLVAEDSGEQKGSITVGGVDPRRRTGTGMLFQEPESGLVMIRAGDDVAFGLENLGVPTDEIWPRVDHALAAVRFPYERDHRTEALSGGEQQRLALGGVLATRPDLLLLDEPTANLDPEHARVVRDAVDRAVVASGATMLLVDHRVAEWLPLVDRVIVLAPGGRVVADGPAGPVLAATREILVEAGVWVPDLPTSPRRADAPAGDVLIRADGLSFTYAGASAPALRAVDLEVRAGRALAITGPNGAGKSTLGLLLGGLVAPSSGAVRASESLAGRDARRPPHRWRATALATRIGSVFQNPEHQFVTTRVFDELALGPRRVGRPAGEIKSIVDDLLVRLRLDRLALANPYTLSGGEQRRLSVGTALATAPAVLVLDEPTFGQDRRTWAELVDLLAALRDGGRAIVAITHDAALVDTLADERLVLPAVAPVRVGAL